jgi:hypothetical protein
MYTKHFCFEFFDILKYIKIAFQIKGVYAPESKKASPHSTLLMQKFRETPIFFVAFTKS